MNWTTLLKAGLAGAKALLNDIEQNYPHLVPAKVASGVDSGLNTAGAVAQAVTTKSPADIQAAVTSAMGTSAASGLSTQDQNHIISGGTTLAKYAAVGAMLAESAIPEAAAHADAINGAVAVLQAVGDGLADAAPQAGSAPTTADSPATAG